MRKLITVGSLILCLSMLASCGTEDVLSDMTGGRSDAALDSSDSDVLGEQAPADTGTDYTALTADQCVTDDLADPGVLPRITLDCPGADEINKIIQDEFRPVSEDPMCQLYYECAKGAGRVLSVVMVKKIDDWLEFTPFDLDLATGERLSGAALLELLDVDATELAQLEQSVMAEEFVHQFGTARNQTDEDFYNGQYRRTTSPDNVELEKLWFAADGQLLFAGRIYGLAGAEYYEYPLSTGLVF